MTMHSGRVSDIDPRRTPLLQDVLNEGSVEKLIRSDELEDFVTVLSFLDPREATDFARCVFKCRRHKLIEQERRFWLIAKARCAVKGRRAELYAQTLAKVFVAEYFGGKTGRDGKSSDNGNK